VYAPENAKPEYQYTRPESSELSHLGQCRSLTCRKKFQLKRCTAAHLVGLDAEFGRNSLITLQKTSARKRA